jgi:hypothetical protein
MSIEADPAGFAGPGFPAAAASIGRAHQATPITPITPGDGAGGGKQVGIRAGPDGD